MRRNDGSMLLPVGAVSSSRAQIDFEVLRVGETDVELECLFAPSPRCVGRTTLEESIDAAWTHCRSVVVEARAYVIDADDGDTQLSGGKSWSQVGVTCVARGRPQLHSAAEGLSDHGDSSDHEIFTVRIVGLRPNAAFIVVLAAHPAWAYDSGVEARSQTRRCCWMPLRTLALPTYVRCMDRSDCTVRLSVTRPDNVAPLFPSVAAMLESPPPPSPLATTARHVTMQRTARLCARGKLLLAPSSSPQHADDGGCHRDESGLDSVLWDISHTILSTPYGEACLWRNDVLLATLMRGAPTVSQLYFFRCRAQRMRAPGLENAGGVFASEEEVDAGAVHEEVIPAGDVTVAFQNLAAESVYQVTVMAVERCKPPRQCMRTQFAIVGSASDDARMNERRQSLSVVGCSTTSMGSAGAPQSDDDAALREAPSSSHAPTLVHGLQSDVQYVETLPRVIAQVERLTPTSAAVSVSRNLTQTSEIPSILEHFSSTQRLALLAVGGADEPVVVVARVAKRRMTNLMSMRRGSAGSRTSRSQSIAAGSVRKGSTSAHSDYPDFGATMQSAASFVGSDSGSDLESSDEDEDDSDPDDVLEQSSSQRSAAGPQKDLGRGHPEEDRMRETGDIMIRGLATVEKPFVIDGLVSNTAYSIHYYTYALTAEERAEWRLQKDAQALEEAAQDDDSDVEEEGGGRAAALPVPDDEGGVRALRSTLRVDPQRYIGRSLIVTPSPQRPLSIAQLGASKSRRSSSVGSRGSRLKSTASSQQLIPNTALEGDDGYIQNDVSYQLKPTRADGGRTMKSAASYRYRSSTAGSPGAQSPMPSSSPKFHNLSAARGGGSPSPEALAPGTDGALDAEATWADVAKDEALTTVARHVFREMNPCVAVALRSVTDDGAEACFATDFKRTADRVLLRRIHHTAQLASELQEGGAGADGVPTIMDIPDYLLEQLTRGELMMRASAIRRSMKFVFCLRILILPRGEYAVDGSSFASTDCALPMPIVSWEELDALYRRPTHRLEVEHKIRFVAKYRSHGQPNLLPTSREVAPSAFDDTLGSFLNDVDVSTKGGVDQKVPGGANSSSMALSQNALQLLHQTHTELTSTEKVKAALSDAHVRSDSPNPIAPQNSGGYSPRAKHKATDKFTSQQPPQPPKVQETQIIEATVKEYVFVCGHSKFKLPPLPSDTRFLVSICGVYAPERPDNFEEMKAAFQAAVDQQEARRQERRERRDAAAAGESPAAAQTPLPASDAVTPADAAIQNGPDGESDGEYNHQSDAIPTKFENAAPPAAAVVPDIDAFTVSTDNSLRTPSRDGLLTDGDDDSLSCAKSPAVFAPVLHWRPWTTAIPLVTNYVVREVKILYVHSDGFRFDVNPMLSEIEVSNCETDHAALAHVMAAHMQQSAQKYLSAELTCLDDARYSRTVLLERDPTTACFEFIHSLKFDGRYQLRVRVGELPASALQTRGGQLAAKGGMKKSRGPSAVVSPANSTLGEKVADNEAGEASPHESSKTTDNAAADEEDENNALEGFLRFGPAGPTTDFVMCYGNVVDIEEMERGLRCFLHPPYAGGHKTEYSLRARKSKLTSDAVLGAQIDVASRDAFVLSKGTEGDIALDPAFHPSQDDKPNGGVHVLQVCSYVMVGCGTTGMYTSYPVFAKELSLNVALLRCLRPDSYNVSVRYLIVLSETIPSWRFGGRIQQNTSRVRSRTASFEQPSGGTIGRQRGGAGAEGHEEATAEMPKTLSSAEAPAPLAEKPELTHQDNAVVLLGRRHTVAATGSKSPAPTRLSAVAQAAKDADRDGPSVGRRSAAAALAATATPRLITSLHTALRASTRYSIGTGTVYRRHELLPLRVGEHFATLCAVVSSYALFDLMAPMEKPSLSSALPSPSAGNALSTFLSTSQQFSLRPSYQFCEEPVDAHQPIEHGKSPTPKKATDDEDDASSDLPVNLASHNPEQLPYYDDTNGTGEVLLGMHECAVNEFAEPVFSRRGKPLRYPSLPPDVNITQMSTVQEQRMSRFLQEVNENIDRLSFHESAFSGTASSGQGDASASSGGGGGTQSMADIAAQILKKGDLSPWYQQFRREVSGVQVELTQASETSTRHAKVLSYIPQSNTTITLNDLLPATEYRVRMRVQGRYMSSIGSSPNWSRWSLPIRFTTQEKLVINSSFATESAIMMRWVREKALADEMDEVLSASASASTFGGSSIGGKHGHHHRAPTMDVRLTAGIVDQRKYQLPTPPPPSDAAATQPAAHKKKETYLVHVYTNTLPFEVEVCLLDNSDTGNSKRRRQGNSVSSTAMDPHATSTRRVEPAVLQQCRIFIPPFLGGLKLKDCYPGMKYSLRVRTTCARDCEAALADGGDDGSATPPAGGLGALRRRRSSVSRLAPTAGGRDEEANVGVGAFSPRVMIGTLSDVMVTLLKLGAAYCTFRIDKLTADMSALRTNSGAASKRAATSKMKDSKAMRSGTTGAAASDDVDDHDDDETDTTADDAHHAMLAKMSHYEVRCRPAAAWMSEFEHKQAMKEKLQEARKQQTTTTAPNDEEQQTAPPDEEDDNVDENLAVGLEQYSSLLIQWRRPTFQGVEASRDVGTSANAGSVRDPNAEREVTVSALAAGTMYVMSIRPFIVGQFAGQWVDMVRFCTPEAPKPRLLALCEDQMLIQWKEPSLRHATLLNQDSARAMRSMELQGDPDALMSSSMNSTEPPAVSQGGGDDASSVAESSSMSSSMVLEGNQGAGELRHGPIPFEVCAVELQVRGRFCDPSLRRFGTDLSELYNSTPEVTLTKFLPITCRVRERLAAMYRKKSSTKPSEKMSWGEGDDDASCNFIAPFRLMDDIDDGEEEDLVGDKKFVDGAPASPCSESTGAMSPTSAQGAPVGTKTQRCRRDTDRRHPPIGLELLLENAFPDATYEFTVRFCDQHQQWSPPSEPWIVVTQPTVEASVLGSGESYAVVRTQRAARSRWSHLALQMLRDYSLFARDKALILEKCIESLKSRLTLVERYGEDLASGMADSSINERSFGDDDLLSKEQLLEEVDLLLYESEKILGVEGAPVAISEWTVARSMAREFEYLHRDLISRRARRFKFATLDTVSCGACGILDPQGGIGGSSSSLFSSSSARCVSRARGSAEAVSEVFTAITLLGGHVGPPNNTASLQAILGVIDTPAVFDDARLYDPNCYTVELAVVERSSVDLSARPSRQYLFGRATLAGTLSSFDALNAATPEDEIAVVPNDEAPQDVVVKRESCDLISVCHLKSGTTYALVTRVNAGHTTPPPASNAYAAYSNANHPSVHDDGGSGTSRSHTATLKHLFTERKRCASFFDPAVRTTAFTSGMWSDVLTIDTLPNILVQCRSVGFSEVLFEVYRPLKIDETIPDDEAYEEIRNHNRFLSLGSRSAAGGVAANLTSNAYQLSINGKHTPLRDMQRFLKGEKKLVHIYKLPPDAALVVSCRSRFSLDEFLRDAESSLAFSDQLSSNSGRRSSNTQQQSSVRNWLRPETLARRKEIVFWSNWMPLKTSARCPHGRRSPFFMNRAKCHQRRSATRGECHRTSAHGRSTSPSGGRYTWIK